MSPHVIAHAPAMQQTPAYRRQDLELSLMRQYVGVSAPRQHKSGVVKTSF